MVKNYIIADSGATKCQWTIVQSNKKTTLTSLGISPYFLSAAQIQTLVAKTFKNKIKLDSVGAMGFKCAMDDVLGGGFQFPSA